MDQQPVQTDMPRAAIFGRNIAFFLMIFLVSFFIRFYHLGMTSSFTGDESMHVASAVNYTERGYFGPDNWYHPPLKHVLLYGSMRTFGDNSYGWRLRNVLFGAASILMLFVLVRELFPAPIVAYISAGLLLLDPLHIMFSRSTFEDIPALFFLLGGIFCSLSALRHGRTRDWVLAGISFGLALSLKWYALNVLFLMIAFCSFALWRRDGLSGLVRTFIFLSILPLTAYLWCYLPWFLKGHTLTEWVLMQSDALREMRHLSASSFHPILQELGNPAAWFSRVVAVGFNLGTTSGWGTYIVIMNNLPVWILVLPALLFLLIQAIRDRDRNALMIGLLFFSLYLPFLLVDRPIFLYSSLAPLPFGFIAVGWAADRLLKRHAYVFLIAALVWSSMLYPLVVGIPVPLDLFQPLLTIFKIFKPS